MTQKPKLELTWIGKENRPACAVPAPERGRQAEHADRPKLDLPAARQAGPRILLEDRKKSSHAPHRVTDRDLFDNRLIFGDNLLALKARAKQNEASAAEPCSMHKRDRSSARTTDQ